MSTEYRAACRGCHGGCVHILTVENNRVIAVRPDPDSPLNHGRACVKGMTLIEQLYHPDRLVMPRRRIGERGSGVWADISWDEALNTIANRFSGLTDTYGAECISLITGTGRHHLPQFWRFGNVLGTPNATSAGALICLGPRKNAGDLTAGHFAGVDYYGATRPGAILVWGANPLISGADGELQFHMRDALRERIPLVVVDPKPNELTRAARYWLPLRPGTDGALALGLLNIILSEGLYDRGFCENYTYGLDALRKRCAEYDLPRVAAVTGLSPALIRDTAVYLASVKPLSMEWGCALEQTPNALQACRAVFMIPAVTGNYDIPGGFVESMEIAPTADLLFDRLSPEQAKKCISGGYTLCDGTASPKLFAHPYLTLDAIKTGKPYKIRALLSSANNTLLSMADARHTRDCLTALEFFVCIDFFMTPTAELADIVLPAAMWCELDSVFCMPEFGDVAALSMRRCVQTGGCRSDEEIFMEISRRMGRDYGAKNQREINEGILRELVRRRPEYTGLTLEKFQELGYIAPERHYYNYKSHGFATPTGKFELYSTRLEQAGNDPLPYWTEPSETPVSRPELLSEYPLILTTGSRTQPFFISNNRQIKSLRRLHPFPLVSMGPATAEQYGIADGQWCFIETARGRITQKAHILPDMQPGVVSCEMGWWYPEAGAPDYDWDVSNANILTVGDAPHDPVTGSYTLRGLLCRIYPDTENRIEERYRQWMGLQKGAQ